VWSLLIFFVRQEREEEGSCSCSRGSRTVCLCNWQHSCSRCGHSPRNSQGKTKKRFALQGTSRWHRSRLDTKHKLRTTLTQQKRRSISIMLNRYSFSVHVQINSLERRALFTWRGGARRRRKATHGSGGLAPLAARPGAIIAAPQSVTKSGGGGGSGGSGGRRSGGRGSRG